MSTERSVLENLLLQTLEVAEDVRIMGADELDAEDRGPAPLPEWRLLRLLFLRAQETIQGGHVTLEAIDGEIAVAEAEEAAMEEKWGAVMTAIRPQIVAALKTAMLDYESQHPEERTWVDG